MDPESVATLLGRMRRLSEPSWSEDGHPRWLEQRPEEGGRTLLVEARESWAPVVLNPPGTSLRSHLHGYGGASYIHDGRGGIFGIEEESQVLLHFRRDGTMRRLVVPTPGPLGGLVLDPRRRRLLLLQESPSGDRLWALGLESGRWEVLHEEPGFLMQPAVDPTGNRLAWIAWDETVMPWERSRLVVALLDENGRPRRGLESYDGEVSHLEPSFTTRGELLVLRDEAGHWRLERLANARFRPVAEPPGEVGRPAWNSAVRHYGWTPRGTLVLVSIHDTRASLYDRSTQGRLHRVALPYTEITDLAVGEDQVLVLAGSVHRPLGVVLLDLLANRERTLATSLPENGIEPSASVTVRSWHLPPRRGLPLQAWRYTPSLRPPRPGHLVLRCHGGPTSAAVPLFDPRVLLWCASGAEVLDLNYRGSSGFGRSYRLALAGLWGRGDVVDLLRALARLASEGFPASRIVLAGSSAGGYTVLRTLERQTVAGAILWYPVTDPAPLQDRTIRFERPYGAHLFGRGEKGRRRLAWRRPRPRGGLLTTPLLVLHGEQDEVVPAAIGQRWFETLRAMGGRVERETFPAEGHGFRRTETLLRAYGLDIAFLRRLFPTS